MNVFVNNTLSSVRWIAVFFAILCCPGLLAAQDIPKPTGYVNDFAGVLSSADRRELDRFLSSVSSAISVEIAVVTVSSTGDPWDYATRLYDAWKIGNRETDEGLLILVSLDPRQVVMETGYGLEGVLPDGRVGEILDRYVVPELSAGNYALGLYRGAEAAARIIANEKGIVLDTGTAELPRERPPRRRRSLLVGLLPLIILILLFSRRGRRSGLLWILLLGMMGGGRGGYWGGGGGGFGGGFGGFGGGATGGGGASRGF
jgi:uncharacterized protein